MSPQAWAAELHLHNVAHVALQPLRKGVVNLVLIGFAIGVLQMAATSCAKSQQQRQCAMGTTETLLQSAQHFELLIEHLPVSLVVVDSVVSATCRKFIIMMQGQQWQVNANVQRMFRGHSALGRSGAGA